MKYVDSPEYKKAYESKKIEDGGYAVYQFCNSIHGKAGVECIPSLLRLFGPEEFSWEANEFLRDELEFIFNQFPKKCTKAIVENILILEEEDARECMVYVLQTVVDDSLKNVDYLVQMLKSVKQEKREYFVSYVRECYEQDEDDETLEEILKRL